MEMKNSIFSINKPVICILWIAFLIGALSSCVNDDEAYFKSDYGVYIEYKSDGSVAITNPVDDGGVTVTHEGQHVSVSSVADDVTYFLSGETVNGSFKIITSEHKQNVVLNGVSITNPDGGAINIQSKKKTYIVLPENKVNFLTDGGIPEADGSKATLFSEGDLIFNGKGKLSIAANRKHGICSDDYLEIYNGEIEVTKAPSDGLHVHDYIAVYGGKLTLTAESDGMDCDRGYIDIHKGEINVTAGNKGIATTSDSASLDRHISILGGTITIKSLGTAEKDSTGYGLRSAGRLYIEDGNIQIDTKKKGISAGKSIDMGTGTEDEDGDVFQPQELRIVGGEITCTGTVRPETNTGSQNCLYYTQEDNMAANSTFVLSNVNGGAQVMSFKNSYKTKKVFFSSSKIQTGGSYKIVRAPNVLYQFNNIQNTFTSYPPFNGTY